MSELEKELFELNEKITNLKEYKKELENKIELEKLVVPMKKKKILFFTGAGVSKESGIETFRDGGGMWHKFNVNEVASIDGWKSDKKKVIDFYNLRRKEVLNAKPNSAHKIIAELEKEFDVVIVTQNVDTLHEQAGSTKVIHLHGNLGTLKSEFNHKLIVNWTEDLKEGDLAPDGAQLRPNIVWFGEMLNRDYLNESYDNAIDADLCVVVGTSMQVHPANQVPFWTKPETPIYYVDPGKVDFLVPMDRKPFFKHIKKSATVGMADFKKIKNIYK